MNSASHQRDPEPRSRGADKEAWTLFWADPTQTRCSTGAPEIWQSLTRHWISFAASLPRGTRVLDLGCGAGAVGRMLLNARDDLYVTGVDSAAVPVARHPRLELLSGTGMESLPFAERSFGAVVSQFAFEYSQTAAAAREVSRVLAPGARLSFLVHHAESAIVTTNRSRLSAVVAFLGQPMRTAFCNGDAAGFNSQMTLLVQRYPDDTLIADLARALPARLGWIQEKRYSTWEALEEALAPERCFTESLDACCVAAAHIDEWLAPLRLACELEPVAVLREPNGDPIAWKADGVREPTDA